jgi:hypothetical protein
MIKSFLEILLHVFQKKNILWKIKRKKNLNLNQDK